MMEQDTVDGNHKPKKLCVLIEQLKDPDYILRIHAAAELQEFPDHSDVVVPALTATLNDVDPNVRFTELYSLGGMAIYMQSAMQALRSVMEHSDIGMRGFAYSVFDLDGSRQKAMLEYCARRMNIEGREYLLNLLWDLKREPSWRQHITLLREKSVAPADD